MFKNYNFKIFGCNPNDPDFDLFKFIGKINLYISTLREETAVNGVINKITKDFEKIVAVTQSKELKRCAKNILPNYKKWKTQSKKKPIKLGKQSETTYCFGCKDYANNFRPEKVKMTNKIKWEKSHCDVCWSNKSRYLKQKIN